MIYLDDSGSTASPSGFLVFPNFWQISSRAFQVDLFVMVKVLLLWLTAKPLILAQGCQEACVYLQCKKCSSGLFSLLTPYATLWLRTGIDFLAVVSKWKQCVLCSLNFFQNCSVCRYKEITAFCSPFI